MTDLGRCQAFTERSVPLVRGGRRHMRCKKQAVGTRTYTKVTLRWVNERTVNLCGTHLKMFHRDLSPRLESDER